MGVRGRAWACVGVRGRAVLEAMSCRSAACGLGMHAGRDAPPVGLCTTSLTRPNVPTPSMCFVSRSANLGLSGLRPDSVQSGHNQAVPNRTGGRAQLRLAQPYQHLAWVIRGFHRSK